MTEKKYCHEFNNLMDLYIHDELDSYGREKFDEHIAACTECKFLLDMETAAVRAVKKFGEETPDIASAVMKRIIDNKLTVDKPKRRFRFAPSLIPAAVAVIAVTLFSRTNIMKMLENNFDSSNSENAAYDSQVYGGEAEIKKAEGFAFSDENPEAGIYASQDGINDETDPASAFEAAKTDAAYNDAGEAAPSLKSAPAGNADSDVIEETAAPDSRIRLAEPEENAADETDINIQDMTDEYNGEIFDEVMGQLNAAGAKDEEAINTLIVLRNEDEDLLLELLQDIEYENVNGIIMANISSFERFILNSNYNNYKDFKIYQEDTESNILAFTFENSSEQNQGN